jgi:hypothetical protein
LVGGCKVSAGGEVGTGRVCLFLLVLSPY